MEADEVCSELGNTVVCPPTLSGGGSVIFEGATFANFVIFWSAFEAWCKDEHHMVAVSKSNLCPLAQSDEFKYSRVTYICVHGLKPSSRGIGKRPKRNFNHTSCEMLVSVAMRTKGSVFYTISKLVVEHNYLQDLFDLYPQNTPQ